jgi:hypothetical protein
LKKIVGGPAFWAIKPESPFGINSIEVIFNYIAEWHNVKGALKN